MVTAHEMETTRKIPSAKDIASVTNVAHVAALGGGASKLPNKD